jgi:outer membrane receptor protein involved in Fe transport
VTIKAGDIAVITALTEMLFRSGLDVVVDQDGTLALVACRHPGARAEIQDSGTIVGTVTEKATGAVIVGATVVVEGTDRSATTGDDGGYRIERVVPGTHRVRARYIGYASLSMEVIVPEGGEVIAEFGLIRSTQKLDELVTVTPGGMQTDVKALATPVTIITADDIAERRPETLQDVIRQSVPTAIAFKNPITGHAVSFFSVRGASSLSGTGALKIFIDGLEASRFGFAPVDPASIERVEVIRGPQAATVYGADAASGVVQIFTKRGKQGMTSPQVGLQVQAGVAETPYAGSDAVLRQQYTGSLQGTGTDVSYNLGGSYTHLDDYLPNGEMSRQSSPSIYGGMRFTRGIVGADLSARYYVNKLPSVFNPLLITSGFVPFSRPNYQLTDFTNETYGVRILIAPGASWRNQITAGVDRQSQSSTQTRPRLTTPDDTLYSVSRGASQKVSFSYNTSLVKGLATDVVGTATAGIDHYNQEANSFSTVQALNTRGTISTFSAGGLTQSWNTIANTGYFAQAQLSLKDAVFVTAGLRAEDNSTFGRDLNMPLLPRVGLSVVRLIGQTTVKLRGSYGKAIRSPAVGQAFGSVSPTQIQLANPLLSPEQQSGWDAGFDLEFGNGLVVGFTGYQQIAEDLISQVQVATDPLPTYQFQNIGRVKNRGFEIEGTLALPQLRLNAQYGYVSSRIEDLGPNVSPVSFLQVGDRPLGLPAHTAGASVTVTPRQGTSLTAGVTYVGNYRQSDLLALFQCIGGTGPCGSDPNFIVTYPGFAKINASLTQRVTTRLDGFISVDNLTNSQAYEDGNPSPVIGRITMVGIHARY